MKSGLETRTPESGLEIPTCRDKLRTLSRHCERSEAISLKETIDCFVPRNDVLDCFVPRNDVLDCFVPRNDVLDCFVPRNDAKYESGLETRTACTVYVHYSYPNNYKNQHFNKKQKTDCKESNNFLIIKIIINIFSKNS
jgi:hypothetical protein